MKKKAQHWANRIADTLINKNPDRENFVLAAGISPSGNVHIGNFRDVITSEAVYRCLLKKGKKATLLFSWDDYDRFRKVPAGISSNYENYIGKPLSEVTSPYDTSLSYAGYFEKQFEDYLPSLGIVPEFRRQNEMYKSGAYNASIVEAMNKRIAIARILADFKTQDVSEEEINAYYPYQIYCEACGKDTTTITSYNEDTKEVTYSCECGHSATVNILEKNIGKLQWKVDWPMRWKHEGVLFEPGGKDHSAPGGSFQVASRIAREVFDIEPPLYQPYEFIGLTGLAGKMSGSTGINISPKDLLEIYEPELLRWLFLRTEPRKSFDFCFNSEIIRQYDEFDREITAYNNDSLKPERREALELSHIKRDFFSETPVAFRQIATFGQVTQGNVEEIKRILNDVEEPYSDSSLERRLALSQKWVETYAEDFKLELLDTIDISYFESLSDVEKEHILTFFQKIYDNWNLSDLTTLAYAVPKDPDLPQDENKIRQRNFFKNIYYLLIKKDTGPRLPTFLISIGKDRIKSMTACLYQ